MFGLITQRLVAIYLLRLREWFFERFKPVGVNCTPFSRDSNTRPTVCYITTHN